MGRLRSLRPSWLRAMWRWPDCSVLLMSGLDLFCILYVLATLPIQRFLELLTLL